LQRFDPDQTLTHWQMRLELIIAYLPTTDQRVFIAQQLELPNESIKRLQQLEEAQKSLEQQLSQQLSHQEALHLDQTLRQRRATLLHLPLDQVAIPIQNTLFQEQYRPQTLVQTLEGYKLPMLVLLAVRTSRQIRRRIWQYLTHWSQVNAPLDGHDLKALGYQPGPQYREMLDNLLDATLDGVIQNQTEAKQFLAHHYPQ
jgi:tRNA nucleotidyltransferase (CCA-adding enzyme)